MNNAEIIEKSYDLAKEQYAGLGVDVEEVLKKLDKVSISLHCWQTDDVSGFESNTTTITFTVTLTGTTDLITTID